MRLPLVVETGDSVRDGAFIVSNSTRISPSGVFWITRPHISLHHPSPPHARRLPNPYPSRDPQQLVPIRREPGREKFAAQFPSAPPSGRGKTHRVTTEAAVEHVNRAQARLRAWRIGGSEQITLHRGG